MKALLAAAALLLSAAEGPAEALRKRVEAAVEAGDGKGVLEAFGELNRLGPDAYPAVSELSKRIEDDAVRARLGIQRFALMRAYDAGFLKWVIGHPENDDLVRDRAVTALKYRDSKKTIENLREAVLVEKSDRVAYNMVWAINDVADPRASEVDRKMVRSGVNVKGRAFAAEMLGYYDLPENLAAAREALKDPEEAVQQAARFAILALDPPQDGILVMSLQGDPGANPLLQKGDLILSVDGAGVATYPEARKRVSKGGKIRLLRDEKEVELDAATPVSQGWYGRPAKRKK